MKVAVSFAGENRELVESIVKKIKQHYNDCNSTTSDFFVGTINYSSRNNNILFYDEDYSGLLCGQDLIKCFKNIYGKYDLVFGFIDCNYLNKSWTGLEQSIIKERLLENGYRESFFIPIMLDESLLDFYPNYMGYINGRDKDIDRITQIICDKIDGNSIECSLYRITPDNHADAYRIFCNDLGICLKNSYRDCGGISIFQIQQEQNIQRNIIVRRNCYGLDMFSVQIAKTSKTNNSFVSKDNFLLVDFLCYHKNENWILIDQHKNRHTINSEWNEHFANFHLLTAALISRIGFDLKEQ